MPTQKKLKVENKNPQAELPINEAPKKDPKRLTLKEQLDIANKRIEDLRSSNKELDDEVSQKQDLLEAMSLAIEKKEQVKSKSVFEILSAIDVNKYVEKKKDLTYLSWAHAWSSVKSRFPSAVYSIKETEFDETTGFMCHTTVTIEGQTLEMWLPVMDGANKSMLKKPYNYTTRYGEKTCSAATTFDINKTIMRCLVKNLAMFGLGIYIYAGEDMPVIEEPIPIQKPAAANPISLPVLKVGDDKWTQMKKFVTEQGPKLGLEAIIKKIGGKYQVTEEVKKEIGNIIKSN